MRCSCGCEFEPGKPGRPASGRGSAITHCPACGQPVRNSPPDSAQAQELEPLDTSLPSTEAELERATLPRHPARGTEVPILSASNESVSPSLDEMEALSGLDWKLGQTVLDRFVIKEIKAGGMGVVYFARDLGLDRDVAIKTLQKRCLERPGSVDRFLTECIIWIRLTERHPNIVQAYFAKRYRDVPLLFLEYVDGASLRARMRDARLAPDTCLDIAMQIAFGLLYSWERHYVVHRDIKPENILITTTGIAKITDFGLATVNTDSLKIVAAAFHTTSRSAAARRRDPDSPVPLLLDGSARLTQVGEIVGTVPYMSPEQVAGEKPLDTRSDIYAFGLTLYEMVTHRHPFYGTTITDLPQAILYQQPPPPSEVSNSVRNLPVAADIDRLIMRCLEKDPDRRYADFDALLHDLERVGSAMGVEPHFEMDKRFMLIGPKEWQEKIASLRELGADQEAKEAEEESAFQAALGVEEIKTRAPIVTHGERRPRGRVEKNTVLRQIGTRQLLCVFEGAIPAYDPDMLIRQVDLNGWFSERSPVWGKELAACDGYVVRIQRSGGTDRDLEARASAIEGCASEAMLLNAPRVLADLPPFYLARQWSELTTEAELARMRAMVQAHAAVVPPDDRLLLRDFEYQIARVTVGTYREVAKADPIEYASGSVDIEATIRAGATFPSVREYWDEVVTPALKTGRAREYWKALWKLSACLRSYRKAAPSGPQDAVVVDLLHMISAWLRLLETCPGLRELSRPFPHIELKLRKGAEPAGRALAVEIVPWLEPYLYGSPGSEGLPLPLQSGSVLGKPETWTGTVSLPATYLAVRIAGKRTETRKLRLPDADDPEGGEG